MNLTQVGLTVVFVVYGATFLVMAVALLVFSERTAKLGIAYTLRLLALFALLHGLSDLTDVALRMPGVNADPTGPVAAVRLALLVTSFLVLLQFGLALVVEDERLYRSIIFVGFLGVVGMMSGLIALYAEGATLRSVLTVERASRLVLGLPAALVAAAGFLRLSNRCITAGLHGCAKDARLAAASLAAYAIVAGAVATGYPTAVKFLGLPIQFYRMVAAVTLTVASVNMLRRFQVKSPRHK